MRRRSKAPQNDHSLLCQPFLPGLSSRSRKKRHLQIASGSGATEQFLVSRRHPRISVHAPSDQGCHARHPASVPASTHLSQGWTRTCVQVCYSYGSRFQMHRSSTPKEKGPSHTRSTRKGRVRTLSSAGAMQLPSIRLSKNTGTAPC